MADKNNIRTFIISLPKDEDRRNHLGKQLRKCRIPFSVIDAVHGASLSNEELATSYDLRKSLRLFNREMSKGEIGCALSHVAIYRKMVAEDIPYALILEDDADIIDRDLPATLSKLARLYPAQAPVAVLLNHVKRFNGKTGTRLDDIRSVYDAYRGVCAHGYFVTKAAAEALLKNLYPVYVVADKWEYFQENFIAVKALVPYSVGITSASLLSSIDAMGARAKKVESGRNIAYYARRYLKQLRFLIGTRPFIRIEFQEKSELDFR